MESYQIQMGEETEETKIVNVTFCEKPFATATYYKGKGNTDILISKSADRKTVEIDQAFVKMRKDLKSILSQLHEEDLKIRKK